MATFNIISVHIPQSQSVFFPHVFCVISVGSGSDVSSSVSVKSDWSKDYPPTSERKHHHLPKGISWIFHGFRKYISECLSYS